MTPRQMRGFWARGFLALSWAVMQKVYGEDVLTNSAFAHYITKRLTVLSSKP
jgi:hypothetical protein